MGLSDTLRSLWGYCVHVDVVLESSFQAQLQSVELCAPIDYTPCIYFTMPRGYRSGVLAL